MQWETSASSISEIRNPDGSTLKHEAQGVDMQRKAEIWVEVPAGKVTVGVNIDSSEAFGWDNEFPEQVLYPSKKGEAQYCSPVGQAVILPDHSIKEMVTFTLVRLLSEGLISGLGDSLVTVTWAYTQKH